MQYTTAQTALSCLLRYTLLCFQPHRKFQPAKWPFDHSTNWPVDPLSSLSYTLLHSFLSYALLHSFMFPTSPKVPTCQMTIRPLDHSTNWPVGQFVQLASWPVSQLTDYPVGLVGLVDLVGQFADYPIGPLAGCPVGWLTSWPVGRFASWPVRQLAAWPLVRFASWPVGRLSSWPDGHLASWPDTNRNSSKRVLRRDEKRENDVLNTRFWEDFAQITQIWTAKFCVHIKYR